MGVNVAAAKVNIPPNPCEECHCQHCNLDRTSPHGAGDSLLHCGAQAHLENYTNAALPQWDTPEMVRNNLHSIIDRYLDKYSEDDWLRLLQHYEYVDFDVKFTGWNKEPTACSCNVTILSQKGCQCGGV